MGEGKAGVGSLKLVGGRLCLDFCNTAEWHAGGHPDESLTSYEELVAWGCHAGALGEVEAARLLGEARRRPEDAARVLVQAIALREALFRAFVALTQGEAPLEDDLAELDRALAVALRQLKLARQSGAFAWAWTEGGTLDRVLWPVARSAAEMLTSGELSRVRQCPGDDCGWLFLDTSRNHSRRWCAMEDCGNRAKARRHYQRVRQARA